MVTYYFSNMHKYNLLDHVKETYNKYLVMSLNEMKWIYVLFVENSRFFR